MKRLLTILIVVCLLISFVSCGNSGNGTDTPSTNTPETNNPTQPATPEPEPTAYEQLNENEKIIFDALMINFDQFLAPSTIRITKIFTGTAEEWDTCGDTIPREATGTLSRFGIAVTLKISGENASGGKINAYYILQLVDGDEDIEYFERGRLTKISDKTLSFYLEEPEFEYASTAKLNKALIEYCDEMGLN